MSVTRPRVTVSLVCFNGARWLPGCLRSLDAQDLADFEVILHDNASTDTTVEILDRWAGGRPNITVRKSPVNLGYPTAHNLAIRDARGDSVLLLNQDVELDTGFLSAVVATLDAHPSVGSVQARLRQLGAPGVRRDTLDTTGLLMGRDRRAYSRSQGRPDGPAHRSPGTVWGADGPAPVYRLSALRQARLPCGAGAWEVLDESFFLYKEDVDLAWRLRLLGWVCWYEPAALAWHARGTGGTGATGLAEIARTNRRISRQVRRLSWRNQRLMQIKNEDAVEFVRDLPWIARRELLSFMFMIWNEPRDLSAIIDLVRMAPSALRKRRILQRQRRLPDTGHR